MNNPWNSLATQAPYILGIDSDWIRVNQIELAESLVGKKDSQDRLKNYSLRTDITPFPYYGNPNTANIFVLQANPGYDPDWESNELSSLILDLDRKNLLHQNKIPLCYTQPKYAEWKYDKRRN
jgi:hypothetical protein